MTAVAGLPSISIPQSVAAITFDDMSKMADAFAKGNLFNVKTKEAALSLLMIAQAEGIHPALAVMEYDIIEGKPARKAERLLARFQMSGGKVEWIKLSNTEVEAKFSHPQGSTATISWTIADAARIKYYTKDGWKSLSEKYNWKSYPRAMLRSRVISEGVRTSFPGASLVTLTSEEAVDAQYTEVAADAEEAPNVIEAEVIETGFLKGKEAEAVISEIIDEFAACNTKEELAAEFARVEQLFKRRLSGNRWMGVEHERDNRETNILKAEAAPAEAEKPAKAVASKTDKEYAKLMQAIVLVKTDDDMEKWKEQLGGIDGLKRFTDEQRQKLKEEHSKAFEKLGALRQ